jgi:hypothetical protein
MGSIIDKIREIDRKLIAFAEKEGLTYSTYIQFNKAQVSLNIIIDDEIYAQGHLKEVQVEDKMCRALLGLPNSVEY